MASQERPGIRALESRTKTEQVTVGAKVGFCLYDIGQIWANAGTRYYDGSVVQFCDQGDPSSTTIEMGVTPGWKDVYGYTLNQQWVDVSAVAPGIYYLSNQTDTSNQILESDETNNGISFHPDPVTIPGYVATDTSASTAEGVAVDVSLPSDTYGSPGSVGYEITTEPANGTVTVDAAGTATYTPDPGFWGDDGFEFAVFDTTSSYPTVRPTATVAITITNSNTAPDVTAPGTQSWTEGDPVNLTIAATDDDGDALIYTATGLPDGLDIPTGTNTITGTPTTPANGTATINVTDGDDTTQINFNWTVEAIAPPSSGGGGGGSGGGGGGGGGFGGGGGGGSVPAPVPPLPIEPGFDDVPTDHPFFAEITWLATEGITNGCGPTSFCPDDSMTRAQLASFLVRTFDLPASETDWFDDDNGSVHEVDINALASAGITTGCGPDAYCPEASVTRAEWASFLVRAMFSTQMNSTSNPFSDDDGSVHESAIGVLWDQGLTTGCGTGTYCPDDHITRGQLAAFLYRQFGES